MESGELEMWKGFEELTNKNVKTIADFTQQTRALVNELKKEVNELKGMVHTKNQEVQELKGQVSGLQAKLYIGGTH